MLPVKPGRTESTDKLRREVNRVIRRYVEQGIAEVVSGAVFVDELHMLDIECFTHLNALLESPLAPAVILTTNRGQSFVRGMSDVVSHGITRDFLDECAISLLQDLLDSALKCMIVKTDGYTRDQVGKVIPLRATVERSKHGKGVFRPLAEGEKGSLRHRVCLAFKPCAHCFC